MAEDRKLADRYSVKLRDCDMGAAHDVICFVRGSKVLSSRSISALLLSISGSARSDWGIDISSNSSAGYSHSYVDSGHTRKISTRDRSESREAASKRHDIRLSMLRRIQPIFREYILREWGRHMISVSRYAVQKKKIGQQRRSSLGITNAMTRVNQLVDDAQRSQRSMLADHYITRGHNTIMTTVIYELSIRERYELCTAQTVRRQTKMAPRGRPTRLNPGTTPPPVTDPTTTTSVTSAQLQAMIDEGVTAVLAARATTRNGDDSHTSGTGARRNERTVRECTYQDFMKCQPLFFRGTEAVVDLTQWFERMETVFRIMTNEVAYAMTWSDLKKKMTTKYCPRNEIKKVEAELWNLKVQGTDVVTYNQRFQNWVNAMTG
ncbi:reverse transcriptase domain-containing protein [Tanacetum coccineum]